MALIKNYYHEEINGEDDNEDYPPEEKLTQEHLDNCSGCSLCEGDK